jgi:4'-phosphopantetheinyl transferase
MHQPALLQRYWYLLTETEKSQARRFHFPADQHRYLVTRVLLRTVLSRYAPVSPAQWRFSCNAYGKPAVANDGGQAARIAFNLSHSGQLVVLCVSCDHALGIDTECLSGRPPSMDTVARYFCAEEALALAAIPTHLRAERFYRYWTLKEAYIKARGMGMSIPLDQFSFDFGVGGHIAMHMQPALGDRATRWRFWQWRQAAALIAVCAPASTPQPQQLTHKRIIPLVEEQVSEDICATTSF